MKGFETPPKASLERKKFTGKKDCPAMKGFETHLLDGGLVALPARKKDCPAMKGFETS